MMGSFSIGRLVCAARARFPFASSRTILREQEKIRVAADAIGIMVKERYVTQLLSDRRYADPKRLERSGFKVFSQYDEDGIIEEIFRRIGTTDKRFVEVGVESGVENNTLKLLLEDWRGLWIEGSKRYVTSIKIRFSDVLNADRLAIKHAFVTAENINELIRPWATGDIDLFSIDIDGNDYYVWEALDVVRPRVVVIEYNARFPPPISIAPQYQPMRVWSNTDYMGSSLEALARLGKRRGYSLVGCNFTGANAFFVRDELVEDKFQEPFSAKNHYQPARYFLSHLFFSGHTPDWGPYIRVPDTDAVETNSHEGSVS